MNEEDELYKDKNSNRGNDKANNYQEDFYNNFDNDSSMDDADEDLLALLDMISAQDDNLPYEEELLSIHPTEVNEEAYNINKVAQPEDIVSLDNIELNDFDSYNEEEKVDDLLDSILDLDYTPSMDNNNTKKVNNEDKISDVGGVFSNVISAVDLIDNETEAEFAKLTQQLEHQKQEVPVKLGFFQRIFGKNKDKVKAAKKSEDEEGKPLAKKESKKPKTKEKKAKIKKNNKKTNSKMEAAGKNSDDLISQEKSSKAKVKKAKKDKKKQDKKTAIKKTAEPKVKPSKKAKEIVNEITEDTEVYNVSKLLIVFISTFIILVSGFVILGTNAYSYSLNLKNAKTNFDRQRYTEAYNEIYGLDIRKQDQAIYDKIMTVMYVNKQVNSYNNYMDMDKYPEALDSLLKGLERYDKYLEKANELGIKKDLDSIKLTIIEELNKKYQLTEKEAQELNALEDQSEYSIDVISIALENTEKVVNE